MRKIATKSALVLSILLIASLLSGMAAASVKVTSPLTTAKLVKAGDAVSIVHSSGFTLDLPGEDDISVYEARDKDGIRKLYLSSSKGPILEISAFELDPLEFGPIDGISSTFFNEGSVVAEEAMQVNAAGLTGLNFKVTGKASSTSGSKPVRIYTLLTDYERAISIIAYAQETSLDHAKALLGGLLASMRLDGGWKSVSE